MELVGVIKNREIWNNDSDHLLEYYFGKGILYDSEFNEEYEDGDVNYMSFMSAREEALSKMLEDGFKDGQAVKVTMIIEKRLEYILSLQKEIERRIVDLQCDIKCHISAFQSMSILYSIGNIDVVKYQNEILIRVLKYNNQKQWRIISQTEGIIDYGTPGFFLDVKGLEEIFQKTKEAK